MSAFETAMRDAARKPFAELGADARRARMRFLQRAVQAVLGDSSIEVRRDSTGVMLIAGGAANAPQHAKDEAAGEDAAALAVLRQARQLGISMRGLLKLPRGCTREELMAERRKVTPYTGLAYVVRASAGRRRCGAAHPLDSLVSAQATLAAAEGELADGWGFGFEGRIPILICADATPLWRSSATRCDVHVGFRAGGPQKAGDPSTWTTWWTIDGGDDAAWLRAMDNSAGLNAEVAAMDDHGSAPIGGGRCTGFMSFVTGDGKGMGAGNHEPGKKCWLCNDHMSLEPSDSVLPVCRWGAFLRHVTPDRRPGDYAHANARNCTTLCKRTRADIVNWVANGQGSRRALTALNDLWGDITQEANRIPVGERVAMRPTKEGSLDITAARMFLDKAEFKKALVDILETYFPDVRVGGDIKVSTAVSALLACLSELHTFWRQKTFFNSEQVARIQFLTRKVGAVWEKLGWRPSLWIHWTVAHCAFFAAKYRTIYFFSSIPTEHRNSRFKVELKNSFRGWALRRPLLSRRGLLHVLNMHALDVGLALLKAPQQSKGEGGLAARKRVRA